MIPSRAGGDDGDEGRNGRGGDVLGESDGEERAGRDDGF